MTLENKIGYTFSDRGLLETALIHASLQDNNGDNERLEFLGDRVLGLAIADLLFNTFPAAHEGSLAKRHTGLVQQGALARVAREIGLAAHLKLSVSEMKSGGHEKETILSDALEALLGAIYRDGGFDAAYGFVRKHWGGMLLEQLLPPEDAKSRLQEWAQEKSLPLPVYTQVGKLGADHAPQFEIEVAVAGVGKASAIAANKRAAEKIAAAKMLEIIGIEE